MPRFTSASVRGRHQLPCPKRRVFLLFEVTKVVKCMFEEVFFCLQRHFGAWTISQGLNRGGRVDPRIT